MININYPWAALSNGNQGIALLALAMYGLLWLLVLVRILTRTDLDPVTRLTWVIIVIFVPIVGLILYVFVAPPTWTPRDPTRPDHSQFRGTPWENRPGHTRGGGAS